MMSHYDECWGRDYIINNKTNLFIFYHIIFQKRLQKELAAITKDPPKGVVLDSDKISRNLAE